METVLEDDEPDENEEPEENKCHFKNDNVSKKYESIVAITASERLNAACYRMVNKNSCSQFNCEYSHDKAVIAVTSHHILYYCTYYSVSFTCTVHCTIDIDTLYVPYMFPVS